MLKLGRAIAAAAFGLVAGAGTVAAQDYPNKPVTIILGAPAGGGSDLLARVIAAELTDILGQRVLVENREGAGHIIASQYVQSQPADGYTVQYINANFTLNPYVYGNLPYDTVADYQPVTQVVAHPLVLAVSSTSDIETYEDLIATLMSKPGELNASTSGTAGSGAMTTGIFKSVTDTDYVIVPYEGGAAAVTALLQGEVHFSFPTITTVRSQVAAGQARVLATTAGERLSYLPDVPTFKELGVEGLELSPWEGFVVKTGTPPEIVSRLHDALIEALSRHTIKDYIAESGAQIVASSPDAFTAEIARQLETSKRLSEAGLLQRQ